MEGACWVYLYSILSLEATITHTLDRYGRDELTGASCCPVRERELEAVPYHQEVSATVSKRMIAIVVAVRAYCKVS